MPTIDDQLAAIEARNATNSTSHARTDVPRLLAAVKYLQNFITADVAREHVAAILAGESTD